MTAKSDTKGDILQILGLTFALCAILFGGWGGWLQYQVSVLEAKRDKAERNLKSIDRDYKKKENINQVSRWRRQQEMRGSDDQIYKILLQVRNRLPSTVRPTFEGTTNDSKPRGEVLELLCDVKVAPISINYLLGFINQVQSERPDFDVQNFDVSRKVTKDGVLPTQWTVGKLKFSAYVQEGK